MKKYIVLRFWCQNNQTGINTGTSYLGTIDNLEEIKLNPNEEWNKEWKETDYGFTRKFHCTVTSAYGRYCIIKSGYERKVDIMLGICMFGI